LNVYHIEGPTYGVAYLADGLAVGPHYGKITIADYNADPPSREISVTLSIVEGSGDPCATDADGDGTPDCNDGCPDDANKIDPGTCGCGTADSDSDGDGTADCNDGCPADAGKITAGVCGCGVPDIDSDGDGTPDCNDACPADAGKITAGVCGCGVPDTDSDGDGTPDCNDGCPTDPGATEFSPLVDGFETNDLWSFDHYSIFPGSSAYRSTWGTAEEHTGSYGLALSNQAYAIPTTDFIPAGAGNHTVSAWVRGEMDDSSYGGWIIRVYFYDRDQQALSPAYLHAASCTGSASCVSTTWTKKSGTVAAPAGTAMIKIRLFFYMAGGWVAFDDLELDGTPITVLNHGVDGGFETTTGWSLSSSGSFPASSQFRYTWGTANQHTGEYALALSNQAYAYPTTNFIAAGSGAHTISAWVRGEMNESSLGGWIIRALYYDSNKQALSPAWENARSCTGSASCLSTTWTEKSGTVTAPTGTAFIKIQIYFYMASGWIAYDDLSLDGAPLTVATHGVDGGFETETGWTWSSLSSFPGSSILRGTSGTADQRSGEYALALSNQAYSYPSTDFFCATTGSYQVSAWLRGEMDDSSRGGWIVRARFYDINKSYISYQDSRACTQSSSCLSTTWSEKTGIVEAPAGTAYMKVQLYFFLADGWVDYDDLEVIKLD
jgi:hypothetical protein